MTLQEIKCNLGVAQLALTPATTKEGAVIHCGWVKANGRTFIIVSAEAHKVLRDSNRLDTYSILKEDKNGEEYIQLHINVIPDMDKNGNPIEVF
jgi:hypothetical protein